MSTRLLPGSVTKRRVPSVVTSPAVTLVLASFKKLKLHEVAKPPLLVDIFGWPNTTSAGVFTVVGILLKIRMRLLPVSVTKSLLLKTEIEEGEFNVLLVTLELLCTKSPCPITRDASIPFEYAFTN